MWNRSAFCSIFRQSTPSVHVSVTSFNDRWCERQLNTWEYCIQNEKCTSCAWHAWVQHCIALLVCSVDWCLEMAHWGVRRDDKSQNGKSFASPGFPLDAPLVSSGMRQKDKWCDVLRHLQFFVVNAAAPRLPLQIEDASRKVDEEVRTACLALQLCQSGIATEIFCWI